MLTYFSIVGKSFETTSVVSVREQLTQSVIGVGLNPGCRAYHTHLVVQKPAKGPQSGFDFRSSLDVSMTMRFMIIFDTSTARSPLRPRRITI
jgi:hypothetical protein